MLNPLRLAAAACLLPCAVLAADHPAVKLGLWEISRAAPSTAQTPIPEDVLARFPPEARARFEAAQHARTEPGGAHSSKQCITQGSLERIFQDGARTQSCTRTIVAETATSMEMHLECKSVGPGGTGSTGTFKWTLPTPETLQGTLELMTVVGPRSMSYRAELKGKLLGPDCGDVKPRTPTDG